MRNFVMAAAFMILAWPQNAEAQAQASDSFLPADPPPVLPDDSLQRTKLPIVSPRNHRPSGTTPMGSLGANSVENAAMFAPPGQVVPQEKTKVSVLGYHDFSETKPVTEMRMRTSEFARQMKFIKDQGITVISLDDFLAWKFGQKKLPERCVLITIDDGWLSVYNEAFPILKEYRYPFVLFLYTKYIDVGGSSMTESMIKQMQSFGATIGSHSTTHPYPGPIKREHRKGPELFARYLNSEIADSKTVLEEKFGQPVLSYCYPGGYHLPEMYETGQKAGYKVFFTVATGKVKKKTPPTTLPRHMIYGTISWHFPAAMRFSDAPVASSEVAAFSEAETSSAGTLEAFNVTPTPNSVISTRRPEIALNLSAVEKLDPTSIEMRISGFGKVAPAFNPETKTLTWTPTRPLRLQTTAIRVAWKKSGSRAFDTPIQWTLMLDKYQVLGLPAKHLVRPGEKNSAAPESAEKSAKASDAEQIKPDEISERETPEVVPQANGKEHATE